MSKKINKRKVGIRNLKRNLKREKKEQRKKNEMKRLIISQQNIIRVVKTSFQYCLLV